MSDFVVQKDNELEALIRQRLANAGLTRESDEGRKIEMEETSKMLATFTLKQRLRHRHLSEWGLLPSSAGGGWDLLYVPDDGKDH